MTAAATTSADLPRRDDAPAPRRAAKGAGIPDDLPLSMAGRHNPWLVAVVVSVATFMEVLDTSIANVSLEHIAGGLGATYDQATWVLTSYLVSNAIVLPISGWLATTIGRKPFYMICVTLFTVSSLLCGLAPSLGWLVFFRVLQGLGGGGLAPSEQAILHDSFPPRKWGSVFALYGVVVVVAPAIGPTLGGWITDHYSWHWIFLINVPVGVVSLILSWVYLTEPPREKRERAERWGKGIHVDYIGFGLVALGLGALQVVLDKGEREDWFGSTFIVVFSVVAGVSLVVMVIRELSAPEPVVDIPLFKNRGFAASNVVMFAVGFILFGTTQLIPQFVQTLLGYTATRAGLVLTPGGFFVMLLMPLVGFLLGRVQPKYLIALGMLIEFAAMRFMSGLNANVAYSDMVWARVYQASGLAFLFVPISTAAYIGIPAHKSNNAAALINLSRNMGGSFGISLAQTWLARRAQFHQARLVEGLGPASAAYRAATGHIARALTAGGAAPAAANGRAVGTVYGMVQKQAAMLAYLDVFHLMAWGAFLMVPVAFILRDTKRGKPAGGAGAH